MRDAARERRAAGVVGGVGHQGERVADAQAGGRVPMARLPAGGDREAADLLLAGRELADRAEALLVERRDRRAAQRAEDLGARPVVEPAPGAQIVGRSGSAGT